MAYVLTVRGSKQSFDTSAWTTETVYGTIGWSAAPLTAALTGPMFIGYTAGSDADLLRNPYGTDLVHRDVFGSLLVIERDEWTRLCSTELGWGDHDNALTRAMLVYPGHGALWTEAD